MTVRLEGHDGPQPRPVILKGANDLPLTARVMERNPIVVDPDESGLVNITATLDDLGAKGVTSVLVEGGAHIARSFLDSDAVDELVVYIGAKIAGGAGIPAIAGVFDSISSAIPITISTVERVGPDIKIRARMGRIT